MIAVRLDARGPNSRWYAGAGLIRPVRLILMPAALHVPIWAVGVQTIALDQYDATATADDRSDRDAAAKVMATATVRVNVTLANKSDRNSTGQLTVMVSAADRAVAVPLMPSPPPQKSLAVAVPHGAQHSFSIDLLVAAASLWTPRAPYLYHVVVRVEREATGLEELVPVFQPSQSETEVANEDMRARRAAQVDELRLPFGIRTIQFDGEHGFLLNGEPTKLRGGNVHHAHGPLGAAAVPAAEDRKVAQLKAAGYNAVRTSHNPPSTAFLDACDRMGLLVMEELFDCWAVGKNSRDYHLAFEGWWERDLDAMVLRDRHHPSIVMWSIGNEIRERYTREGMQRARALADRVRALDHHGRAITSSVPTPGGHPPDNFSASFDVVSYNYACGFSWTSGCDFFEHSRERLHGQVRAACPENPV